MPGCAKLWPNLFELYKISAVSNLFIPLFSLMTLNHHSLVELGMRDQTCVCLLAAMVKSHFATSCFSDFFSWLILTFQVKRRELDSGQVRVKLGNRGKEMARN